ncbi:ADP-dependent NAD(P)H-hydrate dehydratase [Gulosibacter bifidus]|uniref:ADP-dependent (S)-NAD(P)H-hydrate dehydratase n=1 Tax=Gulosibacter bifidus TaxID=272239 RepID=A0ABW5RHU5_9MICO|nr:ADP/ATP-dependent (S)-NAD(P)H-hydrate dehydratase [Gulosibacter bifidus]
MILEQSHADLWSTVHASQVRAVVQAPVETDNKYRRGVVLLATGSHTYPGAAVLTAQAACRTGAGMVRYLGPNAVAQGVLAVRPEVVHGSGTYHCLVIGSGIPDAREDERSMLLQDSVDAGIPAVVDAGALCLIEPGMPGLVITPHARELSVLLKRLGLANWSEDDIASSRGGAAQAASELLGCTVLLKGRHTYIAQGEYRATVRTPNSWLATAGTGDVLAGVLGTLIASQIGHGIDMDATQLSRTTAAAAWLHARAGWLASQHNAGVAVAPNNVHAPSTMLDHGPLGGPVLASDVAQALPGVVAAVLAK